MRGAEKGRGYAALVYGGGGGVDGLANFGR